MKIKIVNRSPFELPKYQTSGSAGLDLQAHLSKPLVIGSLERYLIPTGLYIELPLGHEAQVRPRSGLAFKHGITVLNSPGTIDSDYRGEIKVLLVNLSKENFIVQPGERIAQLIIASHQIAEWQPVDQLSDTSRGSGGYGSTGKI